MRCDLREGNSLLVQGTGFVRELEQIQTSLHHLGGRLLLCLEEGFRFFRSGDRDVKMEVEVASEDTRLAFAAPFAALVVFCPELGDRFGFGHRPLSDGDRDTIDLLLRAPPVERIGLRPVGGRGQQFQDGAAQTYRVVRAQHPSEVVGHRGEEVLPYELFEGPHRDREIVDRFPMGAAGHVAAAEEGPASQDHVQCSRLRHQRHGETLDTSDDFLIDRLHERRVLGLERSLRQIQFLRSHQVAKAVGNGPVISLAVTPA